MIFIILGLIFVVIVALFVFPQFSPIPYFPSNKKDLPLILKALSLKKNQVVIDLGAGDGIVVFKAASEAKKRKLNTSFIAAEINPVLVLILHIQRLLHSNRKNITILWKDMFRLKIKDQISKIKNTDQKSNRATIQQSNNITIYTYVSPWLLAKIVKKIRTDVKKFDLVSYFYPLPKENAGKKVQELKGIHPVYKYIYA